MPAETGKFYLTGLGILMHGVNFTQPEQMLLDKLCKAASESDAVYWDTMQVIRQDPQASVLLERLKNTLRSLGKGQALQAYYDREHRLQR